MRAVAKITVATANPIQSNANKRAQEFLSARISNNSTYKLTRLRFPLIRTGKNYKQCSDQTKTRHRAAYSQSTAFHVRLIAYTYRQFTRDSAISGAFAANSYLTSKSLR